MTDNFDILSLIPQRPPFVMVEKLLYADDKTCSTSFIVPENNVLVCDGYFTEAGLMENIAQTVAAGAGYKAALEQTPVTVGYIAAIKNFEVHELPQTGDELITEINFKEQVFNMRVLDGTVKCADKLIATCEMKIFVGEE